jgi:hypothetical protein
MVGENAMKMKGICVWVALFLLASLLTEPVFCQTAPERSNELCEGLKQTASENGKNFTVIAPGACLAEIDTGYNLMVTYKDENLHVGLVQTFLDNGNPSAFWLRLSMLDNLANVALGTKQRTVFDGLNKLAKQAANEMLPLIRQGDADAKRELHGSAEKATLGVFANTKSVVLMASANMKDIDKMKRSQQQETTAGGDVSRWRRILSLALLSFAAGAKGYTNGYQAAQQRRPVSCYTNFQGRTAITNCY